MRILYSITKSNFGGAQRYVYDLATTLNGTSLGETDQTIPTTEKCECVVALGGQGALLDRLEASGIPVFSISNAERDISIFKDISVFFNLISIIRKQRPDVLHINSSKIGGIGAVAGRLCGVPHIIFTAHGWAFKEPRNEIITLIIKILSWLTIIFSHTTIVLSEKEKNMVSPWPFVKNKLKVIPLGIKIDASSTYDKNSLTKEEALIEILGDKIDLENFCDTPANVNTDTLQDADTNTHSKTKVIGTIAELHDNKGLKYAIEGIAEYDRGDMKYVIIGEGERRGELEKQIKDLGLSNRVILAGYKKDAARLLPAFDIFLLPSVKEGLPYVILEAGAASLPVVATKVGGIPELIENLESGLLIAPNRPNEIRNALLYLNDHPEMIETLGQNLHEKVLKSFNLETMVTSTLLTYKSKIESKILK